MLLESEHILHFVFARPDEAAVSVASCLAPVQRTARDDMASTLPVAAGRDATETGNLLHPGLTFPTKARQRSHDKVAISVTRLLFFPFQRTKLTSPTALCLAPKVTLVNNTTHR